MRALARADANVALSLDVFEGLFEKLAPQDSTPPPPTGHTSPRQPRDDPGPPPRGGRPPGAGRTPGEGPPGPSRRTVQTDNTELLQSVLVFYERFALQNETNPRLQSEAARAYSRVSRLYERLGRLPEAVRASARSIDLLERLIAQYAGIAAYRAQIVEISIMADPWSADAAALPRLEQRLRRAQVLIDQLATESPANLVYVQSQIHVHAKLGAVLQRQNRPDEAEAYFRRAIGITDSLLESHPTNRRARMDRADLHEALGELQFDRGQRAEALALLDEAFADLRMLEPETVPSPPVTDRLENLAAAFQRIGAPERADELEAWVAKARGRHGPIGTGRGRPRPPGSIDRP